MTKNKNGEPKKNVTAQTLKRREQKKYAREKLRRRLNTLKRQGWRGDHEYRYPPWTKD